MLQGQLKYGQFDAEGRFTLTRQAGVTPGTITAHFLLGVPLPAFANVTLEWDGKTIVMPNCRLKRRTIENAGNGGRLQQVIIEDRRWRWNFDVVGGPLYGYYNHYEKGIKVTSSTNIRSIRELATLILDWMGEQRYDVSALPHDFFPMVMWDGEQPAAALEELVDSVGCQVVLEWNNTVRIVTRGVGAAIPNDERVMDYTLSQEPQVIPEFIIVEAGRTLFQADLPLEPIGLEPDTHEIRHIDDLSYKPAGGWEKESPGQFYGVTDPVLRDLAQSCIWKMFRPALPITLVVANLLLPKAMVLTVTEDQRWRILPLERLQLDLWRNPNIDRMLDAQIIGWFCDQHHGWKNNLAFPLNSPPIIADVDYFRAINVGAEKKYFYRGYGRNGEMPFSIDADEGIIRTYEPLFALDIDADGNAQGVVAPPVALRTSFTLRDPDWRSPYRQQEILQVPGGVPGVVKTLRVEELLYEISYPSIELNAYYTDATTFSRQCYFYALRWLNQFYDGPSAVVPMKGFAFDIDVDGAIRSVTFSRDEAGRSTTMLEWHTERPEIRPTYKELFDKKTVNQVVQKFKQANAINARRNGRRDFGAGFKVGDIGGGY